MTAEHYSLALSAIDAKAKQDAQAALYLLRNDVTRMRTNSVEMQVALARIYAVTNAVDKRLGDGAQGPRGLGSKLRSLGSEVAAPRGRLPSA